ncbi:helix-turn-helix domain-containing protein [Aldersonia kunmingensis]|uniref:helix-turn-helix domain-containing protein n=1 Tax=Aldersonia kunmingensis TaxID=408066 RepID=UPI00082BB3D9|nr:helix-turn-helix domain-containing protein [Aldersonia kunmingensis]
MLDVLELVARGDSLRFSDIARRLDLTQGTAHAILATLSDRGWITRDPLDKSYSLGPAMAVVAARMSTARPLAHSAQAVAAQLSADTGYAASVVERVDDSLVITAFEGGGPAPAGAPGERIRFAPPFGVAFAAWDSPAGRRAWIDRAPADSPELVRRLDEILTRTRERGYEVDWTTPALVQAAHLMSTLPNEGLPDHVREITDQLLVEFTTIGLLGNDDPARDAQSVATIAAPVFRDHRVALIVAVHPLRALTSAEVDEVGSQLVRATAGISDR